MNTQIDIFDPLRDLSASLNSCKTRTYATFFVREIPSGVVSLVKHVHSSLVRLGWTLRSESITPTTKAVEISRSVHKNWHNLTNEKKMLMARNAHQILGAACDDPCAFVLCWTPDGSTGRTYSRTGGTGQAIRIAHAHGIPVFNLQRDDHREAWEAFANG